MTAPVAMGDAWQIGGIPVLAAPFAVVTGLSTAMSGKYIFAVAKVDYFMTGWMVRGFALGTPSHGIGTAGVMQVDGQTGAVADVGMGLQVVMQAVLLSWLCMLLARKM